MIDFHGISDDIDAFFDSLKDVQHDASSIDNGVPTDANANDDAKAEFVANYASSLFLKNLVEQDTTPDSEWVTLLDVDDENVSNYNSEVNDRISSETKNELNVTLENVSMVKDVPASCKTLESINPDIALLKSQIQVEEERIVELKQLQKTMCISPSSTTAASVIDWLQAKMNNSSPNESESQTRNFNSKVLNQNLYDAILSICQFDSIENSSLSNDWNNSTSLVVAQDTNNLLVMELFYWGKSSLLSSELRFQIKKKEIRKVEVKNMKPDIEVKDVISICVKLHSVAECLPFLHDKLYE